MGISLEHIYRRASTMGLRKSDAYLTTDKSGRIFRGGTLGVKTQFVAGQKPWNTGRKGWQAGGRSVHTQFTTGMVPPNTQPVGSYRIVTSKTGEKHLEQKVRDVPGPNHKRWTPVSRIVWEAANGPVPKGCIVVFKPGMRTLEAQSITLDRVECITRAQHANRNHPHTKDPELGKLYQLKGAITRQVNRIKNQTSTHFESHPA